MKFHFFLYVFWIGGLGIEERCSWTKIFFIKNELTPSLVSIKLFPALKMIKFSRQSTFSIFRILFPNTFNISKLRRHSKFSSFSIKLKVRFNSLSSPSASRFSILSILLKASERIFRLGRIHRWSILRMSVKGGEMKEKKGQKKIRFFHYWFSKWQIRVWIEKIFGVQMS